MLIFGKRPPVNGIRPNIFQAHDLINHLFVKQVQTETIIFV